MDSSEEPSSLQSICPLSTASELYPKHESDYSEPELAAPFELLSGEYLIALGRMTDGVLGLTNYRIHLQQSKGCHTVIIGLVEQLEVKEIFYLHIGCKDARSFSCSFPTNDQCMEWYKRIHKVILPKKNIRDMFSFAYFAWIKEESKECPRLQKDTTDFMDTFNMEMNRLKFNVNGAWRISQINKDYQMCPSYPSQLLVPACISDKTLEAVAKFRSSRRIPAVVWRHTGNGAVIARSSQPEVGWLGWRSSEDEDLLKALADACSYDIGDSLDMITSDFELGDKLARAPPSKKVLIIDARSYATAVANRARGGGCECPEYYPSCDIQFMNLANIHAIRKSFHQLRQICTVDTDQNWLSALDATKWMQNMSGLLRAAVTVARAVEIEGRPVLVHCSDGWDRTPQIVALAQILLDPYYRTMEGFKVLVEREWLDFGHKFADRCGHTVGCEDPNERCPVFLQWLDCVHQLSSQFKCSFEMSSLYFVKLAQHVFSQLFGTFLCNTRQERLQLGVRDHTFSVWHFLNSTTFHNRLYEEKHDVLRPSYDVRDLRLWTDVYLGAAEVSTDTSDTTPRVPVIDIETNDSDKPQGPMTKTRSFGDLMKAQDHATHLTRRLSDPNIAMEKKFEDNLQKEQEKTDITNDSADESDSDKLETTCGTYQETESKKDSSIGEQESIELPTSNSGDSSTDTLVPNSDATIATDNSEKEQQLTNHQIQENENHHMIEPSSAACQPSVGNQNFNQVNDAAEGNTAPLVSRTSSSIFPASPIHQDKENLLVDYDGLPLSKGDEVQERFAKLVNEHTAVEEALKKELYATRLALINQVSNCNIVDSDRASESSLPESAGSTVDHGDSVPSDLSWEALEEPVPPTRWVPDHAVNRCTGCNTVFWLGRRKHHCRCCGDIFCADCSENWTPLPNEQLYKPVRVCQKCFLQTNPASTRQSVDLQSQQQQSDWLMRNYASDAILEPQQQLQQLQQPQQQKQQSDKLMRNHASDALVELHQKQYQQQQQQQQQLQFNGPMKNHASDVTVEPQQQQQQKQQKPQQFSGPMKNHSSGAIVEPKQKQQSNEMMKYYASDAIAEPHQLQNQQSNGLMKIYASDAIAGPPQQLPQPQFNELMKNYIFDEVLEPPQEALQQQSSGSTKNYIFDEIPEPSQEALQQQPQQQPQQQQQQSNESMKKYVSDAIIEPQQHHHRHHHHPVPLPLPIMACHRSLRKGKDESCDSAFQQKTIVEASKAN